MSEQVPQGPEPPCRGARKTSALLIVGVTIGGLLTLAFVVALVVRFILLRIDRFDWLEVPKQSGLTSGSQAG